MNIKQLIQETHQNTKEHGNKNYKGNGKVMSKYEVKENRLRLVCLTKDKEKVLENIKKYDFLHTVDTYIKNKIWEQIIVDSDRLDLDMNFVNKFNNEVDNCLGTFEDYSPVFD